MKTGEFTDYEYEWKVFHDFYDNFINELDKRCIFIVNDEGKKIGTATISKLDEEEYGYNAVVDWVAISKEYQGKGLARPLISGFLQLANKLGYKKILLHTRDAYMVSCKIIFRRRI
jgi:GNAT superfamily N-acetyltransferase